MFTQNIEATKKTLSVLNRTDSRESSQKTEMDLRKLVREACEKVAPLWPLANFIAVNPLKGFESEPFNEAIEVAKRMFHAKALPDLDYFHQKYREGRITPLDLIETLKKRNLSGSPEEMMKVLVEEVHREQPRGNQPLQEVFLLLSEWSDQIKGSRLYPTMQAELTKWCAAYFDRGEAAWTMPGREQGFYRAWKNLAAFDKSVERAGILGFRDYVKRLPSDSFEAIQKILADIGVPEIHYQNYLLRHLAASPGWSGMFAFYGSEKEFELGREKFQPLVDFLAVRLAYDYLGVSQVIQEEASKASPWETIMGLAKKRLGNSPEAVTGKPAGLGLIWLEAFEKNYRDRLLSRLGQVANNRIELSSSANRRPKAQAIFCIDVRSEAFRRNLEHQGHYDTYGFAGFFAVPLAHQEFGEELSSSQCPVLIRPKYLVSEEAVNATKYQKEKYLAQKKSEHLLESAIHEVKNTSVSPFALVETFGGLGFLSMYLRSFAPGLRKVLNQIIGVRSRTLKTRPVLDVQNQPQGSLYQKGIPFEDRVAIAENSLRIMGLLSNFAKVVLLCGHGSDTANNAYASALDCGACGGHRGAPNARVAAQVFNDPAVRKELALRGINIPEDTVFVAGEHNTATDEIAIFDEDLIPVSHLGDLAGLKSALRETKDYLNWERTQRFDKPAINSEEASQEVERRSTDWSEARPEWGLAGNAAFIVAKRSLTKSLDLGSRTFLHSYDWQSDTKGTALEVIMTAPMVVGEWINTQYYFSSVDNEIFGSGSKVIQNVVGKMGVMQGNVSDLKMGLPLQSVSDGKALVHEPMRLLVVIEAPKERVGSIIAKHESVRKLVVNEWIRLVVLDPADKTFYRYSPQEAWEVETVN